MIITRACFDLELRASICAAAALIGVAGIAPVHADTRITVPGAGPLYLPNAITGFALPGGVSALAHYDAVNHAIGVNWFPGSTPQVVDYPASVGPLSGSLAAPGLNESVAIGQQALNDQIMNAVGNGSVVDIAGLSEGTIVVNHELAYLAADPTAPAAHALQFAEFSAPETSYGFAGVYLPDGVTVPVVDWTVGTVPDTQYNVDVVFGQYDLVGDPPDRPWDLLADVNSVFGSLYFHGPTSLAAPSDAVQLSSVTDSLGGTVTTYEVLSPTLPLLLPLEGIAPEPLVADLNAALTPIVADGYSVLTPDAGPYFEHGALIGIGLAVLPELAQIASAVLTAL